MELRATQAVTWTQPNAPAGVTPRRVYIGPVLFGLAGFQVAVASSAAAPSRAVLRELFTARKGHTQTQVVVAVEHGSTTHVFGPDPQAQAIELPTELAQRQLQSVLAEPDALSASERWAGFRKAHDSAGGRGFSNSGLFATHHVTQNVPQRPDWAALNQAASNLLFARGKTLIEALGFRLRPASSGTFVLATSTNDPRAVAVLLDDSEGFEGRSQRFQLSPVAFGLAVAAQERVPWLVVLRKDQIRLYPGRDGVGVGSKGQSETYFEVDLSTIDAGFAGLLPLVFSASALAAEGTADQLLRDSARYATELGARLRERIYEHVVPAIAVEVAKQLAKSTNLRLDTDGLSTAYRVTLRVLFRLLFQAYAEDRGLLPSGRNEGFDANSLKTNAARLLATDGVEFGEASTIWRDLEQVWNAVDQGNPQWQIPAYNGGLFATDAERSPDGALIERIKLPDSVLGPALRHLLIDRNGDGDEGPVDFRSLSVREFGTIYEGLLESSLSLAEHDLTVDASGGWVPAKRGDEVLAPAGTVYFHSASGERKATGSYFTPKVVVDHLIERSVVPALSAHLDKIALYLTKGDAAAAARDFFDFRVADLAMGSGHFLVAAVDKVEALMRTFLTEHAVPGVTDELLRLASVARDALGTDDVAQSEVDEVGLLRRQVARRCIYGLDINTMAVELARLALWIHTFVPGLPMSNLDHGLICANSLTGIGTVDEALDAIVESRKEKKPNLRAEFQWRSFLKGRMDAALNDALPALQDMANAQEATKAEVSKAAELLQQARVKALPAKAVFDVAMAARLAVVSVRADVGAKAFTSFSKLMDQWAASDSVEGLAARLRPAHMPYLFPEVFLRDNPGFDVIVGNPPWETVKVEEQKWWGLRMPGTRSMPQKELKEAVARFQTERPDLMAQYLDDVEETDAYRAALVKGPFPGLGAGGDPDLYQAFVWRNWQLLRQHGRAGFVVPRMAMSGSNLRVWRDRVLADGSFADVCFLTNTNGWVFETIHQQYTIALAVVSKGGEHLVRLTGPFHSASEFVAGAGYLTEAGADEFRGWSSTLAFPMAPDAEAMAIVKVLKSNPRFSATRIGWAFRPVAELHASADKALYDFDLTHTSGRLAVLKGASFNLWEPDFGPVYAYADVHQLRNHLTGKLNRAVNHSTSAYNGLRYPTGMLPMDFARIAFRLVARATDSRTTVCCLLPPGTTAQHSAQFIVRRDGDERAEAFLLGVMSSIPFDWEARLSVELNFTFEVLNDLNVPQFDPENPLCRRVVEAAGRLAATDGRFMEWAQAVGVPVGSAKEPFVKADLIAELDALVSLLYGLTEDQVEHVFATFHRGWDYEPRLESVLTHYRQWKGRA